MVKRRMPPHIVLPNGMWRFVKSGSKAARKTKSRGGKMARKGSRRGGRRRGGGGGLGLGRITSVRNIAFTLGAAYLAPKLGISSNIGGALGGYFGTKSLIGAAAGYFIAPYAMNMIGGALGGAQSGSSQGW